MPVVSTIPPRNRIRRPALSNVITRRWARATDETSVERHRVGEHSKDSCRLFSLPSRTLSRLESIVSSLDTNGTVNPFDDLSEDAALRLVLDSFSDVKVPIPRRN